MKYILAFLMAVALIVSCSKNPLPDEVSQEPAPSDTGSGPIPVNTAPPTVTAQEQALSDVARMDPKGVVPQILMFKTVLFFNANQNLVTNHHVIGVVDFSLHSSKPRFYIVRVDGGGVRVIHVAHGKNSDPSNSGYATLFGNVSGSEKSSLGFYLTAEPIQHNGTAHVLDGLSSTDSNVRERAIWLHAAAYVVESSIKPGRSWGCLAVAYSEQNFVMSSFGAGGLIYAGLSAKE